MNTDNTTTIELGGKEEPMCKVSGDGEQLKYVLEFRWLGSVLP